MRNKMITLCPTTYEIAQKMPNFSGWVREKVFAEKSGNTQKPQKWEYKCPCCTKTLIAPLRTSRVCLECNWNMDFVGEVVE
jgi:hypothetical protein